VHFISVIYTELMKYTEAERQDKALKEKEKGNEAFHSSDFLEALVYYSRSLQLVPTAIAYNNRAVVGMVDIKWRCEM